MEFSYRPQVFPDGRPARRAEINYQHIQRGLLKPTLVLTTLLFLLVAPAPDSRDLAEMTGNFLLVDNNSGLMAAVTPIQASEEEELQQ